MKLISVKTHIIAVPPPHIGGMYWIIVRLRTQCGIEGVGEIYAASFHPRVMEAAIEDVFLRYLEGQDPHHIERFWRRAFSSGFTQRPDLTMMGIISGLEIACWDIIGKAAGQPVYKLLGGLVNERIRSYTYLYPRNAEGVFDYSDPDLAGACAAEMVEHGYTAVKFDPAGPYSAFSGHQLSLEAMDRCVLFCQRVREAVGAKADILFGTHGQMVPSSAIRLAKRLEIFDPLWFEEPVPPGQPESMAAVARATSIPIAAGERLTTKYEFFDLLQAKAASILQMNLGRVGGLLEAKKIAGIAEVFSAQVAPHLYNGPVGLAASLHLAACTPNFLIQESIWENSFHNQIVTTPPCWEDGFFLPSREPGLGIELDLEAIERNSPYSGKLLHLQMAPDPVSVRDSSPARG